MERAVPRRVAPSACTALRIISSAFLGLWCLVECVQNPVADPMANHHANPRPSSTCPTESCKVAPLKSPTLPLGYFSGFSEQGRAPFLGLDF